MKLRLQKLPKLLKSIKINKTLLITFTFAFAFAIFLTIITIIIIAIINKNKTGKNVATNKTVKSLESPPPEFQHTGKCVNCERQFSENTRWRGQSNKCYDCETDLIIRSGGDHAAAYNGVKTKCFDC
jgi:uncharacterized paraquat-inducible protein A